MDRPWQFLLTAKVMLTYECVLTRASLVDKYLFLYIVYRMYTGIVTCLQGTLSCQHHVEKMHAVFIMLTRYVSVNRKTSPVDR